MTDPHHHWNRTLEMLRAYRESQVLMTAAQMGVFARLADGEQTAMEMAEGLGADRTALRRLLDAAVSLDLLQKDGDRYRNSPLASACLTPGATITWAVWCSARGSFTGAGVTCPKRCAVGSGLRKTCRMKRPLALIGCGSLSWHSMTWRV